MKKKQFPLSGMGIALLAILIAFSGYTAAKYVRSQREEPLYVARSFYFESDLLESQASNGEYPKYTLQDGTDSIAFQLKNHADDLRFSEVDIDYKVELTTKDGNAVDGQSPKTGELARDRKVDEKIEFTGLSSGTYVVIATATGPYTSTLKAEFTLEAKNEAITASISDSSGSPVLRLTVSTTDYAGDVKITWPDGVRPDNTDPLLSGAYISGTGTAGNCTVDFKANSEYTFLFFKDNPSTTYSIGENGFSVNL